MCRACATSSFCSLCTPAQPSSCFLGTYRWLSLSTVGGPHRSVHANVLPSPVLTRAYSFRIPSGRGGIAPPVQRGAAHPRTNPAARAAGGEPPPLKAPRALRAPRKCRSSSGPGGHTPLSQLHRCGTVLGIRRSMSCCLGPASGSALVSDALPARTHTHTLRHPWACQYGAPVHFFLPVFIYHEALCPFRFV